MIFFLHYTGNNVITELVLRKLIESSHIYIFILLSDLVKIMDSKVGKVSRMSEASVHRNSHVEMGCLVGLLPW
jgi:hypothetical protein